MNTITLALTQALAIAGQERHELTVRIPTVADRIFAEKTNPTANEEVITAAMLANCCDLTLDEFAAIDAGDYLRLRRQLREMDDDKGAPLELRRPKLSALLAAEADHLTETERRVTLLVGSSDLRQEELLKFPEKVFQGHFTKYALFFETIASTTSSNSKNSSSLSAVTPEPASTSGSSETSTK